MNLKPQLILIVFFLLICSVCFGQVAGYQQQNIQGYNVYVELVALNNHPTETNEAISFLSTKLEEINNFNLQPQILDSLQAVTIFMDWNTTTGAAVYHPSAQWLLNNGYIVEKAKCVELSNIVNFVNWSEQNQPFMVMHELTHAYHDRVLGYSHAAITEAYNSAMTSGIYDLVSYHTGFGNYIDQEAYATNNHIEYFAEISEAFLGLNDFYPFTRTDLETHDALGYAVAVDVWQFQPSVGVGESSLEQVRVYPNPVNDVLNIVLGEVGTDAPISILSLDGRTIKQFAVSGNTKLRVDVSDLEAGIYLVRVGEATHKLVKR